MRLFFGLSLPQNIREKTARCSRLAQAMLPGRYALPENHHITLAFLGEVDESRVAEAAHVLASVAADFPAPQVTLGDFAHFGREQNAILILKAASTPDLAPLHDALVVALAAQNLPFDPGPFSPHVTLARHVPLTQNALHALHTQNPSLNARFSCPQAHVFLSARDEHDVLRYTPIADARFHP